MLYLFEPPVGKAAGCKTSLPKGSSFEVPGWGPICLPRWFALNLFGPASAPGSNGDCASCAQFRGRCFRRSTYKTVITAGGLGDSSAKLLPAFDTSDKSGSARMITFSLCTTGGSHTHLRCTQVTSSQLRRKRTPRRSGLIQQLTCSRELGRMPLYSSLLRPGWHRLLR